MSNIVTVGRADAAGEAVGVWVTGRQGRVTDHVLIPGVGPANHPTEDCETMDIKQGWFRSGEPTQGTGRS